MNTFLNKTLKIGRRIEFKLLFWYALIFIVSWLCLFLTGFTILKDSILTKDRQLVTGLMDRYALAVKTKGIDHLIRELKKETPAHISGGRFVMLADRNDNILSITLPYGWPDLNTDDHLSLFSHKPDNSWHYLKTARYADDIKGMAGRDEVEFRIRELSGQIRLWMGQSAEFREEYLESIRDTFFWVMAMVVVSNVAIGLFMSWRSMAPVRALKKTIERVLAGRKEARIPLDGRAGELSELAGQFNIMLDRNDSLIQAMKDALDNVAHDLRTPLTRMGIAIEQTAMKNDPGKLREALFDCAEESQRISGMLTILMDISEAETGVMALNFAQVNLDTLFHEVIDIYEYVAGDKGVSMKASTEPGLYLTADQGRLKQVMCNLVDNAVKYSPSGTRVDIAAKISGHTLKICVTDRGVGIAPEETKKIFERLYRCDHSRQTKGSGLGLSLVRAVVQAHGGHVSVQSTLKKGSVFCLYFPLSQN